MRIPPECWRGFTSVLADHYSGELTAERLASWAADVLTYGLDTPNLRILAGLPAGSWLSDATPYFRSTLAELGWPLPPENQVLRAYLRIVAEDLVEGRISPDQAAERIHRQVVSPLGHPADLRAWCLLWEGNDPADYHQMTTDERETALRAEAEKWLPEPSGYGA